MTGVSRGSKQIHLVRIGRPPADYVYQGATILAALLLLLSATV